MKKIKVLQINVWGGRIKDGLTRFITDGDYDVVCMQEAIWSKNDNGFLELFIDTVDKIKVNAGYKYDFRSSNYGIELFDHIKLEQGNAVLSKIPFLETEEKMVYGQYATANKIENFKNAISEHGYTAQKVVLENNFAIINYHGYWQNNPIGNETTIECMKKVAELARTEQRPLVLCGDLNVTSESPAMRELDFLQDLTAINNIKSTLRNVRFVKDVACDHILINGKVLCTQFKVIDEKISDHKALYIEMHMV